VLGYPKIESMMPMRVSGTAIIYGLQSNSIVAFLVAKPRALEHASLLGAKAVLSCLDFL
jgi:hypothetical protein